MTLLRSRTATPFQSQHSGSQPRQNVNAPVFVPKGTVSPEVFPPNPTALSNPMSVNLISSPFPILDYYLF